MPTEQRSETSGVMPAGPATGVESPRFARGGAAPVWLRKLREAAAEYRREPVARASYTERFQLAADLMAFATARLAEQSSSPTGAAIDETYLVGWARRLGVEDELVYLLHETAE